ncbi:hypothetical protein DPEC_G00167380 [Dallia pectoralis]|uniref:Uncharacterized protein n=1 Tax=Dallia pectoralis TaxID=75939 RepID=A0ACC2GI07_DALPE|nr:hypothetical protein DPEC_G00167380 [Dallia pectoralis]
MERGGERWRGHGDCVMVADTRVQPAVRGKRLKMKQPHRPGSVCRCPLAAPHAFIPRPLLHRLVSPACHPPIGAQGGGGPAGPHQSVFSVRGSGLMLAQHRGAQKKAGTAS